MKKQFARISALALGMATPLVSLAQFDPDDTGGTSNLPSGTLKETLTNATQWAAYFLGALGVLAFIIAGIMYVTAAGNDERMEMAKKYMIWSVVGIAVGLLGLVITQGIQEIFED
jgi:thiol:disulfide interchange protein